MKVLALYRPQSEFARIVEEFAHDFERRIYGSKVELISLDTREGAETAALYGIIQYPAILAIKGDGQLLKHWEGEILPLINEVAAYATA